MSRAKSQKNKKFRSCALSFWQPGREHYLKSAYSRENFYAKINQWVGLRPGAGNLPGHALRAGSEKLHPAITL